MTETQENKRGRGRPASEIEMVSLKTDVPKTLDARIRSHAHATNKSIRATVGIALETGMDHLQNTTSQPGQDAAGSHQSPADAQTPLETSQQPPSPENAPQAPTESFEPPTVRYQASDIQDCLGRPLTPGEATEALAASLPNLIRWINRQRQSRGWPALGVED